MRATPESRGWRPLAVLALLVCCTVLGLAGTDLVLPAIPGLPAALGGNIAQAQWVLAAFAAGTGLGLLLFGELGSRFDHRRMLAVSLLAYALLSGASASADSLLQLIALRFFQGVSASCAAVVTPGMVRRLFDESGALRALGALGSIESLAPAIAPIFGVWLLDAYGWQASFWMTAALALLLSVLVALSSAYMPAVRGLRSRSGYRMLLQNPLFQRYALSQGLSLGSLLVFVFAMPTVFVVAFGGQISEFIIMQLLGISSYIVAANYSSRLVRRFGAEPTIFWGSVLALAGGLGMLAYGLRGGEESWVIWLLFLPFNMGFGFRGPPGFYRALQSAGGDDARGSALVILYVMVITAMATALVSPFVALGLWPAAAAASCLGLLSITILPELPGLTP